jgi:hypothetical protein
MIVLYIIVFALTIIIYGFWWIIILIYSSHMKLVLFFYNIERYKMLSNYW